MAWRHRGSRTRLTAKNTGRRRSPTSSARTSTPRAAGPSSASTSGRRTATWRYTWGTGFLGRGQRLLSLDYTGSFRRKSGCVTDAAAYGRCVAGLAAKAGDATYFVAGDAPSAVDAVANAIARAAPNTTVVATPGHPIHTGRVDHVQHANRTHHSGHAEGTLKALVDFMMLVASDVFLSNCPDGGSTFAWNVRTLRLGERAFYGRDARVCEGRLALGA